MSTKHAPGDLLDAHLQTLGVEIRGGRSDMAPKLGSVMTEYEHECVEPVADDDDDEDDNNNNNSGKMKKRSVSFHGRRLFRGLIRGR